MAWHFLCYRSICTEDKDAIEKYLSTGRKWEITSVRTITFLCKTVPIAKDLHKLGTLVTCTTIGKRKISAQTFQSKSEVRKKKNIFTVVQFLLLPFIKKFTSFPVLLLPTHTKQHRSFTVYLYATSWSITILKSFQWPEQQ
jgi:hypothetical protein